MPLFTWEFLHRCDLAKSHLAHICGEGLRIITLIGALFFAAPHNL
jgi:hypothetical protein